MLHIYIYNILFFKFNTDPDLVLKNILDLKRRHFISNETKRRRYIRNEAK